MTIFHKDINFNKYHTFFLEYYKFHDRTCYSHLVRPCTAMYEDVIDMSKNRSYTLEAAIVTFEDGESISKIILECSMLGIQLDFINVLVPIEKSLSTWQDYKVFQTIDTHKEDVTKYLDSIDAWRYYVALDTKKTSVLKFLVVDRFSQDAKIDFLKGKYDKGAVIAGFKKQEDAYEMCKKMNEEKLK